MVLSVFLIAVLSYLLSLPDICALVSVYGFQDDIRKYGPSDYAHVRRRFGWVGLCYAVLADLIRASIGLLLGSILLKNAGYPEVGKLLLLFFTVFFTLVGQAFPAVSIPKPRRSVLYPALLLLFADWRVFLVCAAVCGVAQLLLGLSGFTALLSAVVLPVFSLLFRNWLLVSFLLLVSGLSFAFSYLPELGEALRLLPRRAGEISQRLRSVGSSLRRKLDENDPDDHP